MDKGKLKFDVKTGMKNIIGRDLITDDFIAIYELVKAKELWRLGHRYRKNDKTVYGKPDLTMKRYKLAIFVDSEFWHGKDWKKHKKDHKTNQEFWFKKIERNIQRDKEVNDYLLKSGWKVLRFWGQDVTKNLRNCTDKIIEIINESKRENKH